MDLDLRSVPVEQVLMTDERFCFSRERASDDLRQQIATWGASLRRFVWQTGRV